MQRLHVEDPTHFVMTGNVPGEWEQISIPALIDDEYISKLPKKYKAKFHVMLREMRKAVKAIGH